MEGSNPLVPPAQSAAATFGGTANALARLGRPLPGPFAHFASPIAPYTLPSLGAASAGHPHGHAHHQLSNGGSQQLFAAAGVDTNPNAALHSTLASMACAYSFDSLLSANFNNFANLLMMHGPNNANLGGLAGRLQQQHQQQQPPPPLLGAYGAGRQPVSHSPSPTSNSSSSPHYYRPSMSSGDFSPNDMTSNPSAPAITNHSMINNNLTTTSSSSSSAGKMMGTSNKLGTTTTTTNSSGVHRATTGSNKKGE